MRRAFIHRAALSGLVGLFGGGCAIVAGYDFGKYHEATAAAGAGGSGGAMASSSSGTGGGAAAGCVSAPFTFGAPSTLDTAGKAPFGIAVDDMFVYWTDGTFLPASGTVKRVPKAGGMASLVATDNTDFPGDIALTTSSVVWVGADPANTSYILWSTDKKTLGAPLQLDNVKGAIGGVAAHGEQVYYTVPSVGIYTTPATNVNKKQLAPYSSFTTEIAADQKALYFIDDALMLGQGAVLALDLTLMGAGPAQLASGLFNPKGLAIDATTVYWSQFDGMRRQARAGGMTTDVGNGALCSGSLAVDEQYLYCADDMGVIAYPLNGAPSAKVAVATAKHVTVDCEAVYFTGGTNVFRVPKVHTP